MEMSRARNRINHLIDLINLLESKLDLIERALALEISPTAIFKYSYERQSILKSIHSYEEEIEVIKRQLALQVESAPEYDSSPIRMTLNMPYIPTGYYHLLDPEQHPLVSYSLINPSLAKIEFQVTSEVFRYSDPCIEKIVNLPNHTTYVKHLPTLVKSEIDKITELTNATLFTRVIQSGRGIECKKTFPVKLHSRNTAMFALYDSGDKRWKDMSWYVMAWVTPNVNEVQGLLHLVRQHHPNKELVGYQGGGTKEQRIEVVRKQVKAIYDTLQGIGIGYVNTLINFGTQQNEALQRVRLPKESLRDRAANCIDGTVLFASLLLAISLEPVILLIPGHAFIGWQVWSDIDEYECLETTMIGSAPFDNAVDVGNAQYKIRLNDLGKPIFDKHGFLIRLPCAEARKKGISPME